MELDGAREIEKLGRRDFLSLLDLPSGALEQLLDIAEQFRLAFAARELPQLLKGRAVVLWFEGSGFRNRVAFELGIAAMGGIAVHMPGRLGEQEAIEDVAAYLDNWFDCAVVRADDHAAVQRLAEAAHIPLINARTPGGHPCEVLGDLAYIRSIRPNLDDMKVVFVGETTNLCHSWFEAAAQLPIEVVQVCPPGYGAEAAYINRLNEKATGSIRTSYDLPDEMPSADVIYTDCWPSAQSAGEREEIAHSFAPYRVTRECLALAPDEAIFLPCPPVHRGEEVTAEAMTDPRCRVYAAKGYLLHAQNAVLVWAVGQDYLKERHS